MLDGEREMARQSYGYGRWAAPYWFIGPEQGMAHPENDNLKRRIEAWQHYGSRELDDCRDFHFRIDEREWHREQPILQRTWRPLLLLLMSFLGRSTDRESLRNYQRDQWGRLDGETCVIELSGLAAHNFEVPRDRESFRQERISTIRERMRENNPKLVLMYGTSQRDSWEKIAGTVFPPENILRNESTILALTRSPTSPPALRNDYWIELGEKLRKKAEGPPLEVARLLDYRS